ncbi:MAG: DNA-formamidopyrimidine glycosylase family protein, partial [Patescibacteria group bacterium]
MPELPEVHTTASMLHTLIVGHTISDIWTDYASPYHRGKDNIKDPKRPWKDGATSGKKNFNTAMTKVISEDRYGKSLTEKVTEIIVVFQDK